MKTTRSVIKSRREELNISLCKAAELSGVSKSAWHDIENKSNVRPSALTLYAVAKILRCSMEELLCLPRLADDGGLPNDVYEELETARKKLKRIKKIIGE